MNMTMTKNKENAYREKNCEKISLENKECEVAIKKKRKKKKKEEKDIGAADLLTPTLQDTGLVIISPGNKNKKRKMDPEFDSSIPSDTKKENNVVPPKKMKKEAHIDLTAVVPLTTDNDDCQITAVKKKKKKKKKDDVEVSNIISVASDNHDDEITAVKKKKKRDVVEIADITSVSSVNQGGSENTASKKKKKKKEADVAETEASIISTTYDNDECQITAVKKKKKKKKKDVVEMSDIISVASDNHDECEITAEKKKKKKKKTDVLEIPEITSANEHELAVIKKKKKKKKSGISEISISPSPSPSPMSTIHIESQFASVAKKVDTKIVAESEDSTRVETPCESKSSPEVSRFQKAYSQNNIAKNELFLKWKTTEKQLKEAGLQFASGKWTQKEMAILYENIGRFKLEHHINDFQKYYMSVREKEAEKNEKLYEELGENIFRTIKKLRDKLEHMFMEDELENVTKFTRDEIEELIKLQRLFDNNWPLISKKMGRSAKQIGKKWCDISPQVKSQPSIDRSCLIHSKIPFSPEEDEKIKAAIVEFGKDEDGIMKVSDWNVIARHVGNNRTAKSCQQRWSIYLSQNFKKKEVDTKMLFLNTARILKNANIKDMNEVDWSDVVRLLKLDVPEHYIRKVFWNHLETEYQRQGSENFVKTLHGIVNRYSFSSNKT